MEFRILKERGDGKVAMHLEIFPVKGHHKGQHLVVNLGLFNDVEHAREHAVTECRCATVVEVETIGQIAPNGFRTEPPRSERVARVLITKEQKDLLQSIKSPQLPEEFDATINPNVPGPHEEGDVVTLMCKWSPDGLTERIFEQPCERIHGRWVMKRREPGIMETGQGA